MKKWSFSLLMIATALILAFIFSRTGLWKTMSPEVLEASIEVFDIETKWVEKYYQPWPPKLILVPAIVFKVRNTTDKPLKYVNFNANFRFRDDFENLGDSFFAAIRGDAVPPGEATEPILLKSNYGVDGHSLATFKNNPHWKTVIVQLFAQSKGSPYIKIGEWEVSKTIDFKEPEDVGIKKTEETPPDKK